MFGGVRLVFACVVATGILNGIFVCIARFRRIL